MDRSWNQEPKPWRHRYKHHQFMQKLREMIGKRYGRLVVIGTPRQGPDRLMVALCICDCGAEKLVRVNSLRQGTTKSCGCLRKKADVNATR